MGVYLITAPNFGLSLHAPCSASLLRLLLHRHLYHIIPPSPTSKMSQPNGTADAPIEVSSIPTVVGINFGNSYASISVLTKVRATPIMLASEINRRTGRDGGLHRQRGWRTSDCLRDCVSRRGAGEWFAPQSMSLPKLRPCVSKIRLGNTLSHWSGGRTWNSGVLSKCHLHASRI